MTSTSTGSARVVQQAVVVEPVDEVAGSSMRPEIVVRHLIWYQGGGQEQVTVPFGSLREALAFAREICTREPDDDAEPTGDELPLC